MSTFTVAVTGTITVPVDTTMLDAIGDKALADEIANEAVRISVSEKLCQFDGFTLTTLDAAPSMHGSAVVTKSRKSSARPPTHIATVDFDAFAESMGAIHATADRVEDVVKTTNEAIEVCLQKVPSSSIEELRAMMTSLLQTTKQALEGLRGEELVASAAESSEEQNRSNTASEEDDYEREREEMGYQRLVDESGDPNDDAEE